MNSRIRLAVALGALVVALTVVFIWSRGSDATSNKRSALAESADSAGGGGTDLSGDRVREQAQSAHAEAGAREIVTPDDGTAAAAPKVDSCRVRVVWPDGRPAEGADVRRLALDDGASGGPIRTDSAGGAAFDAGCKRAFVVASLGEFASLPVALSLSAEAVLALRATVSALGVIIPLNDPSETDVTIDCYAVVASRRVRVARARAPLNGSWQMDRLPMGEVAQFVFRFESETIVPIERERLALIPGEELRVDVEVTPGTTRAVRVLTTDDKPIEGAEVIATYTNILSKVVRFSGVTDSNGDCHLRGVPPREGILTARKPGYARSAYQHLIHALLPAEEVWTIRMPRAPEVRGVCLAGGEPVTDFDVLWMTPYSAIPDVWEFRGAKDGTFAIDELESGKVCLIAVSDALGQSAPLHFDLPQEGLDGLVIEFDRRGTVVGEVIDAVTEEAIANAIVQPWSSSTSAMYAPRGQSFSVDSNGRFRSSDFNAGINRFEVSAPGYASRMLGVHVDAGAESNAGTIRLGRSQSLDVELMHGPEIVPTESYATAAAGAGNTGVLGTAVFDASGRTRFDNVAPGAWIVRVMLSDGHEIFSDVVLAPGAPWRLLVDHAQLTAWTVEIRTSSGAPLPDCGATLIWSDPDAVRRLLVGSNEHGHARLLVPKSTSCTLRLTDANAVWVRDVVVGPAEFAQDPFVVTLDEPQPKFRVRDATGAALAGVNVVSLSRQLGFSKSRSAQTDASGTVCMSMAGDVSFTHSTLGMGIRLGLTDSDQRAGIYELELDPVGPLEFAVRDGNSAVAGAEVLLGAGGYWLSRPRTDSSGFAKTIPLTAGRWDLRCEMPGYWPAQAEFEVKRDMKPVTLQVRRLADVEFEVRSAVGASIEGCSLDLVSDEFGERASEWFARGRIRASGGALVVDRDGKLTVSGLPHGKYRWFVARGAEGVASGDVVLAPRQLTRVQVVLP